MAVTRPHPGPALTWTVTRKIERIVRIVGSFLAHYLLAAYGYGSEVLLRAVRIAIGLTAFDQLKSVVSGSRGRWFA
ncbi:hypothetical protein GCM10010151_63880 [Actinoallomurus spadix]|uniref:Transposase n=1 Tax=Actinoallomurus spadix TaxID=79912 RepID=A0ABN0XII5_9ACTN